jgi:hypothetical protein
MEFVRSYSNHHGVDEWKRRDMFHWVTDLFAVPNIVVNSGCTSAIRSHLKEELTNAGWAYNVRIAPAFDLTVTGMHRDMAFQIQTGNIARAIYDLMKLQFLYHEKKIQTAAIAVPTKDAAALIGSNVAHDERLSNEMVLFDRIITVPLMLIAFK